MAEAGALEDAVPFRSRFSCEILDVKEVDWQPAESHLLV
jgi:hypothetical protein